MRKLLNSLVLFSLLWVCLISVPHVAAFDREGWHQKSLSGLDISRRMLANERVAGPIISSSSFSDFLVSDINHPARFAQDNPCLLALTGGEWLSAWEDDRLGARKIYWQRITAAGTASGPNVMIAGSSVGNDFVEPRILQDSRGKVYLIYRDLTTGELYFVRFNSDLTPDKPPVLVNDTALGAYAGPADASLFPDGRLVIVWENYGTTSQTINARLFDSSGTSVLGPIVVPSDLSAFQRWVPSVAIDPSTGFLVAWEDYRNGQADIYARQFDGAGAPVGNDFSIVPSPASNAAQYAPRVAFCGLDKYVIGWHDRREGQEVFIQQYNPVSGLVGVNRQISIADSLIANWNLNLSTTPAGTLTATWAAFGSANNILSARFSSGLTLISAPTSRNMTTTGQRISPGLSYSTNKRYGMVWTEFTGDDPNINFMLFDTASVRVLSNEAKLNDDQTGSPSTHPSIATGTDWYDLVAFESGRHDAGDIYCQAVSAAGIIPEHNQRVNQDTAANLQSDPSIACGNGNSLVIWIDSRPLAGFSGQHIYGRWGSPIGIFTTDEFCISDTAQPAIKNSPKAAVAKTGRALTVWLDKRSGNLQVWGRWLTSAGTLDGAEFQISNPVNDLKNDELGLTCDSTGRFYVIWLDRNNSAPAVKGHWYNADKSNGGTFNWAPNFGVDISSIATDNLPNGNVTVLWTGLDANVLRLYLAVLTPAGVQVRQLIDLADNANARPSQQSISVDEMGYVCAAWVDHRGSASSIFYQLFDPALNTINNNAPVSANLPEFMATPATRASRGRAWFTWVDPHQIGQQVYLSNLIYLPTDSDDPDGNLPTDYTLEQNYPNPFNPTTTIEFSLPNPSTVTLAIFNVLGQEVNSLLNSVHLPAGKQSIVWDGRDSHGKQVSSGVYLYRIEAGKFAEQRKMTLIK